MKLPFTRPMETSTRKKIDLILINLGWNTDEEDRNCNVFTGRTKTKEQNKRLKGKFPDYVLYRSGSDLPIAVIETKRKGQSIDQALKQAINRYAKPLEAPLAFATDGTFFKAFHLASNKELTIDGQTTTELFSEKKALRFVVEGPDITEATRKVKHTREELIQIFKWANDILRKEGLREGAERFAEFANILFLKLISEMEKDREKNKEPRLLNDKYCWTSFSDLDETRMLEYINGTVLPHLVKRYNKSGDVFQQQLGIKNPKTLKQIVDKLDKLTLINTDSDVKGDAFEYFLKNSVTVGNDLGEYFTPRHIVRLMVNIIKPQFGEKVYDPTCGTGGFLIEAFNHIKQACKLTPHTIEVLKEHTVFGRELTNTARIAKMNMIITGDGHTNIKQMDSLEHPVKGQYDVVLANIPYGQTTDWGSLYKIPSNQADSVFIQHIFMSLNEKGRAAVIVPEGFLFRPRADKKTREYLLQNYDLQAVISLPEKIFLPYTPSKTNILVFKNGTKTERVWFYDLKADGFELSTTRKPIPYNDISDLLSKWSDKPESDNSWLADFKEIKNRDFNLQVKSFKPQDTTKNKFTPFSKFLTQSKNKIILDDDEEYKQITVKLYGKGAILRRKVKGKDIATKNQYIANAGDLIVSKIDARNGAFAIVPKELDNAVVSNDFPLFKIDDDQIEPEYFEYFLKYHDFSEAMFKNAKGTTGRKRVTPKDILNLSLPLPSKDFQKEIMQRLEKQMSVLVNSQKVLDSLKEGFVDEILFENISNKKWLLLDELKLKSQYGITKRVMPATKGVPLVRITDIDNFGRINYDFLPQIPTSKNEVDKYRLHDGDLLVARSGSIGKCAVFDEPEKVVIFASYLIKFKLDKKQVRPKFVLYYLMSGKGQKELQEKSKKMAQTNINAQEISSIRIPVPPSLDDQDQLISKINGKLRLIAELEKTIKEAEDTLKDIISSLFIKT